MGEDGMSMEEAKIARAAEMLWCARLECRRMDALPPDCRPQTLSDGYAVQDAMAALAGQKVVGWKIAATSAAGQRHIGVEEPLGGRLFADFLLSDGALLPAAPLHMRVAEAEFAFRLGRDLAPRETPYEIGEVCDAVADLHLAIEVPDARFERFAEMGAAQIAADDAFAAWFILGPRVANWRTVDLSRHPVRAIKNGAIAGEGSGANVLGDPRVALTWLANDRSKRGGGLRTGDVITTGTCITPLAVAAGDKVVADFGTLGRVAANFV
jgi:2-keto-4-pentenoate hydratase